ncbi:hypothetical protein E4O00_05910 [Treponema sp. OMZ 788]|uniref:ABC transporter permease n=1 Tax=Treponema sp. OMZ 788 TaxID=2563664 RepID=UPI0020A5C2AA|nr:ABC transporter permease [Treponema sp. OMZ 788]UTC65620.1 hypothetical protein E4O00_05910 [Treponema sp. OMZ 788]
MKVFFRLVKIYLASVFNFKNFKAQIQKRKKRGEQTVTRNSKAKIAGIAVLFLVVFAEFLLIFGFLIFGLYGTAKAVNNINILFEVTAVLISFMSLLFGFMLTISTYYIGEIEEQFLAMPIKPRTLFASKFFANTINSLITSVAFFAVLMGIYGYMEAPPLIFYLWALICALVIPLPMISVCYFFNILIMRFTRIFKNKNVVMAVNGIVGMSLALGFNYIIQSATGSDPEAIYTMVGSNAAAFQSYGAYYPPIKLVGYILSAPDSVLSFLYLVLLIALCAVFPALIIGFMSKLYTESLIGFNEKSIKKLEAKQVSAYLSKNIKRSSPFMAYLKREFKMMNRTPVYLLNGPFSIIFMPVLIIVISIAKGTNLNDVPPHVLDFMQGNAGFVITGLAAGFLGSMTNIADTALSRDAKFIPFIKSLPVDIAVYMYAKLAHAMIFAVFAIVIGVGFASFVFKFGIFHIVLSSMVALCFSALVNLVSLFLDTAHPKLHWDNPVAAMKQNTNILFIMFFNMIILAISAVAVFFTMNSYLWVILIYFCGIPAAIFSVLIKPYGIYAENKIASLEL